MTLEETINQMADDKSNDWAEEIETLVEVEKELLAARDEIAVYRARGTAESDQAFAPDFDAIAAGVATEKQIDLTLYHPNAQQTLEMLAAAARAGYAAREAPGKLAELLRGYDSTQAAYDALPEEGKDGSNYERYEDAIVAFAHDFAHVARPITN